MRHLHPPLVLDAVEKRRRTLPKRTSLSVWLPRILARISTGANADLLFRADVLPTSMQKSDLSSA